MRAIVILGKRLNNNGTLRKVAYRRIELALQAYELFKADRIILSGGMPNKRAGRSEASAMAEALEAKGTDRSLLILEDRSNTTLQNARFTVVLAEENGINDLMVVTSPEHMNRLILNPRRLFRLIAHKKAGMHVNFYCG